MKRITHHYEHTNKAKPGTTVGYSNWKIWKRYNVDNNERTDRTSYLIFESAEIEIHFNRMNSFRDVYTKSDHLITDIIATIAHLHFFRTNRPTAAHMKMHIFCPFCIIYIICSFSCNICNMYIVLLCIVYNDNYWNGQLFLC